MLKKKLNSIEASRKEIRKNSTRDSAIRDKRVRARDVPLRKNHKETHSFISSLTTSLEKNG